MSRATAKNVGIYVNSIKIADAHNCTITVTPEFIEHRAYGDYFKQREVDICDWNIDVEKLVGTVGMGFFQDIALTQSNVDLPVPFTISVYQYDGNANTKLIEGPVLMGPCSIDLANGSMVGEKGAFVAAGAPTYWAGIG